MIWHQFSEGAPQRGLFVAPRKHRRAKKRALIFPAFLPLIILSSILSQTVLLPAALAAPLASYSAPGHNTFQQFQQGQQNKANQSQFQRPGVTPGMLKPNINTSTNKPLPSAEPAKMHDLTFVLDDSFVLHRPAMKPGSQPGIVEGTTVPIGTTPLMAKGSDGRLEVQVPRGSLDFAHAALADGSAPVGQLILQIHQIAGHFIETDSILGTYQLQIVDSQGHAVQGVQMLHPLTIIYHYQPWEMQDLNIDPGQVRLSWSSLLAPVQTAKQSAGTVQAGSATTQSSAGLVVPMTNNAAAQTLTAQTSVINGIIAASATPEIQAPGKPDLFETSGNSGQYSYSYPLSVVPGPAGFMPQLALSYSSQSPNDRHSRRASAGDEGDGWSLGLGSITVQSYPSSSTGGAATWFFLNGVDGISDRLIPIPGKTGYYDTQHISHLSIQWNGDHWRIFAKDGTYFELGKTSDSQQKTASGVYEWDLDKILAPFNSTSQVKTMFIKYHQDSPDGGTTIRDAGIKQIQYGYVTSNTATSLSLIAGTVDFHYHAPNNSSTKDGLGNLYAVAYGTNYNCASSPPSSTTLRCDNPTQSGSVAAPSVMSTMTLDSITSYIGADSANQPAYRYDFAYQDTPFTTNYTDPISKTQETASGEHLLIQITPTIYTQGAPDTRKSLVLGYTGPLWDCTYNLYDEGAPSGMPSPAAGLLTKAQTYTSSDCSAQTTPLTRDYTGYDQYGNVVATADSVAIANKPIYASVGCTLATGPVYMPSSWPNTRYTTCTTYDTTHTANLPVTQANALGQTTSTSYDYTSGAVPSSVTDANGQVTSFGISYSGSNETINLSQPGETGSYTTRQSENSQCTSTSTLPCYEIDSNSSLYPNAISRTFYDAQGRAVETRAPGPTSGNDTVVITVYNDQNNSVFKTVPFQVADGSGWIDPNGAKDINGNTPAGTTTFMDALGRTIATQDPNFGSTQEPGISCSTVLIGKYTACTDYSFGQAVGDSAYYSLTTGVDPNGHVGQSFADSVGNVRYTQTNSGVYGGALTVTKQTQTQYNALNKPTSVAVTDKAPQSGQTITSVTTTMTYDDIGRLLTVNDPDQGTFTYSYDPDSHVTSVVQTSGSNTRTLGTNYDLLGRVGCEQTAAPTFNTTGACSAGNPLFQNTYDTTFMGVQGTTDFPVGRLTRSVATTYYPDGTSATVTNQVQTDQRGRSIAHHMQLGLPSGWNVSSALPIYQLTQAYNDANQPTATTAMAGSQVSYTFSQVYDSTNGVVQGLSNNGNATVNLATLAYNEFAQLGSITLLNGASSSPAGIASETFNYDANLRPLSLTANWLPGSGNSGQILGQSRTFDNASNVTSVNNTFAAVPGQSGSGGTETQNFCYDEQNRMIWSGNGGTQPGAGNGTCGSGTLGNTISGAGYTAPFSYTNLGQIWQGPVNGQGSNQQFLYCNSQPHQLSGIYPLGTTCANMGSATASYSASYDPWGNISSRTYNNISTTLSYDQLNRLVQSNVGSNQEFYVYDASGQRVLKRSTSGGTTTLTGYAFGLQELTYTGSGVLSSQIDYYSLAGHLIGSTDGTTTTYDLTDALGSVLMSVSSSAVLGEQVYGPYGNQRYSAGTMGTDKGYTGQFHDNVTGLDYYNARYYDPVVGQFLSPDSVQGNAQGMSPYAYVAENPETATDPTGHWGWFIGAILSVATAVGISVVDPEAGLPALVGDVIGEYKYILDPRSYNAPDMEHFLDGMGNATIAGMGGGLAEVLVGTLTGNHVWGLAAGGVVDAWISSRYDSSGSPPPPNLPGPSGPPGAAVTSAAEAGIKAPHCIIVRSGCLDHLPPVNPEPRGVLMRNGVGLRRGHLPSGDEDPGTALIRTRSYYNFQYNRQNAYNDQWRVWRNLRYSSPAPTPWVNPQYNRQNAANDLRRVFRNWGA